jgi:FKBP-type peptidyl-prolyl cis-trans isomerase FkpA
MKTIHTGIAVALALVVVLFFFVFPGSLFGTNVAQETVGSTFTNDIQTKPMAIENPTELQMTDVVVGTGAVASSGDTVTVQYVGSLTNGTVFDASARHSAEGFTFNLGAGQVIKGWDQGVAGMKVGGKRLLVIPAFLAYGDRAIGDIIPANSTLVFEVELVKVQKP